MGKRRTSADLIIHQTDNLTIEWFWTQANEMPGLDGFEKLAAATLARFAAVVEHWGTLRRGEHLPEAMLTLEDAREQIYAIKAKDARFPCFFFQSRVIVTGYYRKQGQKLDKRGKRVVQAAAAARTIYQKMTAKNAYYKRV